MFLAQEDIQIVEKRRKSVVNNLFLIFSQYLNRYRIINRKKLIVGLLITDRCNLNCIYCYEKYKSNKKVSLKTLQEIVSKILKTESVWTDVEFRLLGGEPFLESNLIKKLVDWSLGEKWNKRISYSITTNGTCISSEMKKWLRKNRKHVRVILSLDGLPQVQNINRCNSYSNIDFDFFSETWPNQAIKMTVNKLNIHELYNSVKYCNERLKLKVSFNFAGGESWSRNDLAIFEKEQDKIFEYYKKKKETPKIYDIKLSGIFSSNPILRQCGIGYNIVVYDMNAHPYACHLLLPNVMGECKIPNIEEFRNDAVLRDNNCENCIIDKICPTCYAYNFVERGSPSERNHDFCDFYKSIVKFSLRYKIKYYSKKRFYTQLDIREIDAVMFLKNRMI